MTDGVEPQRGRPRKYSDAELLAAMREVRESSEYGGLSVRVYRDERVGRHPSVSTIERQLGSWGRAKRLLEADDD